MDENAIAKEVVDAAVRVHRELGPGLLETVYEVVLARELECRGMKIERQVSVPIHYRGLHFEEGFRADVIVEAKVILELKSVEQLSKVHAKQLLTYLKLKGLKLGFVLNFGASLMKEGIERIVNGLPEEGRLGVRYGLNPNRLVQAPRRRRVADLSVSSYDPALEKLFIVITAMWVLYFGCYFMSVNVTLIQVKSIHLAVPQYRPCDSGLVHTFFSLAQSLDSGLFRPVHWQDKTH